MWYLLLIVSKWEYLLVTPRKLCVCACFNVAVWWSDIWLASYRKDAGCALPTYLPNILVYVVCNANVACDRQVRRRKWNFALMVCDANRVFVATLYWWIICGCAVHSRSEWVEVCDRAIEQYRLSAGRALLGGIPILHLCNDPRESLYSAAPRQSFGFGKLIITSLLIP